MELSLEVKDFTGDRSRRMRLPAEATIGHVRPQIIESLDLPDREFAGEPVTWVLYNESAEDMPVLSDTETVGDVLADDQVVRVVPNIIAGGYHDGRS